MPAHQEALKATLENKGVKFHIKTGNSKWQCTVLDRATHERRKSERTDSTDSVASNATTSSNSSTKSH
ncbi:hypothetical protein B0J18DRAFT_462372 [Chaetomium sp. MPI-SDFR-AT-0129]|nr:hypothetical protein B0J18DRAFT_462372 [Chaetomium sp. MPI-SDFR-AT-0129]